MAFFFKQFNILHGSISESNNDIKTKFDFVLT